ncbi:MAG: TIGR04149 family rSAM-modified RiPP [Tannerellaceae bacterium]|nr:TIGR04149 family rSAM-modified RiPP [Tannerellaceae bacterium]
MKILKKLRLTQLSQNEMNQREMNALNGGSSFCGCGCHYSGAGGGSSTAGNYNANQTNGYSSYGGNFACGTQQNYATLAY